MMNVSIMPIRPKRESRTIVICYPTYQNGIENADAAHDGPDQVYIDAGHCNTDWQEL